MICGNTSDFVDHFLPKHFVSACVASHHAWTSDPPPSKSGADETRNKKYNQGYHTVLISKICPHFEVGYYVLENITVLISEKCSYLSLASFYFLIFCSVTILNK